MIASNAMATEIVLTPKQIAQVTRLRERDEWWAEYYKSEKLRSDLLSMEGEGSNSAVLGSPPLVEGIVLSPKEIAHLERNKAPETPAHVIRAIWTKVAKHNLHTEVVSLVEKHAVSLLAADRRLFEREYCELATRLGKTRTACGKSLSQFYPPPSDAGGPLGGSENFTAINDLLRPLGEALYHMKKYEESPAAAKAREDKKRREMVSATPTPKRTQVEILKDMACRKRDALVTKHGLTPSEAEAVLAHIGAPKYSPKISFPKDTLTALRVINGFAAKNGIRFEDAETVLRE